jgi:hypothetical protein
MVAPLVLSVAISNSSLAMSYLFFFFFSFLSMPPAWGRGILWVINVQLLQLLDQEICFGLAACRLQVGIVPSLLSMQPDRNRCSRACR